MVKTDQDRKAEVLESPSVEQSPGYPKTRRIRFRFGETDKTYNKYFIEDDMAFSHLVAALSGSFPAGEEAFIRSVREVSEQINDPVLKKRMAGFIGQESTHGREHRRVNEKLIERGYPIAFWDSPKFLDRMKRIEQKIGPKAHLALTAASEHYTAVLAENLLTREELQSIPGDAEIWNLLNWHALEELEHKSVAFDVYRAVGGTERMRIMVMAVLYVLSSTVVPLLTSIFRAA